ncbi:hypothetical protein [Streptomyces sp. NPDC001919]
MSGPFDGALFVDMIGERARYECLRPNCPHRFEGPVVSTDRWGSGFTPIGRPGIAAWIGSIKKTHLARHHGETTT